MILRDHKIARLGRRCAHQRDFEALHRATLNYLGVEVLGNRLRSDWRRPWLRSLLTSTTPVAVAQFQPGVSRSAKRAISRSIPVMQASDNRFKVLIGGVYEAVPDEEIDNHERAVGLERTGRSHRVGYFRQRP